MYQNISAKQFARAAQIKERIESLQGELAELLGSTSPSPSPVAINEVKAPISAAGLAKIKEAQRLRWAKFHKEQQAGRPASKLLKVNGMKRTMSPAARAKIRAAAKARWKKAKAAGRKTL